MKSITELLSNSTLVRKLAAAAEKEELSERRRLVEQLGRAERDLPAARKRRVAALEPLDAGVNDARRVLDTAVATYREADAAHLNEIYDLDALVARLRKHLLQSADPRIAEARQTMDRRFHDARGGIGRVKTVKQRRWDGAVVETEVGNEKAVRHLIAAIKTARLSLDRLELQAVDNIESVLADILRPVDAAWDTAYQTDDQFTAPAA